MYEIQDYKDESRWLTALCVNCNSTLADEEAEMVIYSRNSDGKKESIAYDIQKKELKVVDIHGYLNKGHDDGDFMRDE